MSPIHVINSNDVVRLDRIQAISNQRGLASRWNIVLDYSTIAVSMSGAEAIKLVHAWDKYMEWKALPFSERNSL